MLDGQKCPPVAFLGNVGLLFIYFLFWTLCLFQFFLLISRGVGNVGSFPWDTLPYPFFFFFS